MAPIIWIGLGIAALFAISKSPEGPPVGNEGEGEIADPPDGEADPENNPENTDDSSSEPSDPEAIVGTLQRTTRYDQFLTAYAQTPYHNSIAASEREFGIPENLLARLLFQESSFRPDAVGDGGAALGIAQFHIPAATDMGLGAADRANPDLAIPAAARYVKGMYDALGDWYAAVLAYNQGLGAVQTRGLDGQPAAAIAYAQGIIADSEA